MSEAIFAKIRRMYDTPHMQNSLRGQWVEAMIAEILGPAWRHTGGDWAAWDFERDDGLRLEVKQSAQHQSWGTSIGPPRFGISAAQGHYPDGKTYLPNASGARLADIYVFAWHEGEDQRETSQWQFYVIRADHLPVRQKTIGLRAVQRLASAVMADRLLDEIDRLTNR